MHVGWDQLSWKCEMFDGSKCDVKKTINRKNTTMEAIDRHC